MTSFEKLLSKLDRVVGRGKEYTARCPAHSDRGPSLSLRQTDDGRILVHCFAGCSVDKVVEAVGMELGDLFPPKDPSQPFKPGLKAPFYATDLLRIIAFEALVLQIMAFDMSQGKPLSEEDRQRAYKAYERIDEAKRYANV
jgi:hypothetical protein